nr:hypothetical protein [Tanacetum cinerariifolium]
VFRNKKDERGILIRNKARFVAEGHTQEEGIEYDEVFAPIARIKAIRLFLAYASFKNFMVYQMDVKSDFLYGKIEEEVYVCQPLGSKDPDFPDKVYKVEKALYGLHQAPRAWYETLSTYLLDNGFHKGKIDKTLFIKRHKDDAWEILNEFYSRAYLLLRFIEVKNASTPMKTQKPLLKDEDGEEVDVHMYRLMIGSLMYLTSSSLWYPKDSPFDLVAYIDSDYTGARLDRKSTTGSCQFFGCRLISCQCKKQTVVANSTTEAEYVAASSCCGHVLWIQNQLLDYRVLDLEKTTTTQRNVIASLKRKVKKHEKKIRSRTDRLKRLYKVGLTAKVESFGNKESLGEDASKQGRIDAIDADEEITLVSVQDKFGSNDADKEMFNVDVLDDSAAGDIVSTASATTTVSAATTTAATIKTVDDITLAQALEEIKSTKPKEKGIVIQELESAKPMKRKDQIKLDEEAALKLQAIFDEEERLAREKAEKVEEANIALIET